MARINHYLHDFSNGLNILTKFCYIHLVVNIYDSLSFLLDKGEEEKQSTVYFISFTST